MPPVPVLKGRAEREEIEKRKGEEGREGKRKEKEKEREGKTGEGRKVWGFTIHGNMLLLRASSRGF